MVGNKAMLRIIGFMTTVFSTCFSYQKDGKCYKSLNLIIALDASGSINTASWQSGINQSKQIIESFAVADSGNKFAIIEFSTFANVTYQLNSNSAEAINALVNKKDQVNGGHTYIDAGLNEAIRIFDSLTSSQENTQNVLLTVTDGFMTYRNGLDIFDILKIPVEQLKAKNVELYAFSVGSLIKHKTLEFITTEPSSAHVFKSDQVGNLIEGVRKLTEAECPKIACSTVKVSRADKGCYMDNHQKQKRPLPDLIFTDRESGSSSYSGVQLDWENWESYVKGLVCRCAEAVAKRGRSVFGLQYYGECWSGASNNTYAMDGPAEDLSKCVSDTFKNCNSTMLYCVGIEHHNFVYKIVS